MAKDCTYGSLSKNRLRSGFFNGFETLILSIDAANFRNLQTRPETTPAARRKTVFNRQRLL
jgi:hypothetical protein